MAVGNKIVRKVLRNTALSLEAVFVLLLLLHGFVYCPLVDNDSSAAPSPGDSSACPCVHLSRKGRGIVAALLGVLCQLTATVLSGNPFADYEEEEEAAGAAKKAGYVAIRDDDHEVGGDGGKKY